MTANSSNSRPGRIVALRCHSASATRPASRRTFLRHAGEILGSHAVMVVGVDLVKDPSLLKAAYNDAQGVTAKL